MKSDRLMITPPPRFPLNIEGLEQYQRLCVRLNPTCGIKEQTQKLLSSRSGGPFPWPSQSPPPACDECDVPLVPVVQLLRSDFLVGSEVFQGKDALQMLACPNVEHRPMVFVYKPFFFWWDAADLHDVTCIEGGLGEHCDFRPEEVVEYLRFDELPRELQRQIIQTDIPQHILAGFDPEELADYVDSPVDSPSVYYYEKEHSVAYGTKMLGYAAFCQGPQIPQCDRCGRAMEHFFTLAESEFDSSSYHRWCPADRREMFLQGDASEQASVQDPLGIDLFGGDLFSFICFQCGTTSSVYQR